MEFESVLRDLLLPLCKEPELLTVTQQQGSKGNEIVLVVRASKGDVGKLIGKRGSMAHTIRSMMSIAGSLSKQRINIKFENEE